MLGLLCRLRRGASQHGLYGKVTRPARLLAASRKACSPALQPAVLTHNRQSLSPATETGRNRSASLRARSGAAPEGAARMQSRRSARRSTRNFSPGTGPAWAVALCPFSAVQLAGLACAKSLRGVAALGRDAAAARCMAAWHGAHDATGMRAWTWSCRLLAAHVVSV